MLHLSALRTDQDQSTELFNILVNPLRSDFALCWHRDDVRNSADEDEERASLKVRHYGVCDDGLPLFFHRSDSAGRVAIGPVEYVSMLPA